MRGMKSYRRLTIDGAVPYTECEALAFRYDSKWQVVELGDGTQPYYFHLTAGRHTIRLEAVLGEIEYSAAVLEEALTGLNTLYRRVRDDHRHRSRIPCGIIRCIPRYPTWCPPCAVMRRCSPTRLNVSNG